MKTERFTLCATLAILLTLAAQGALATSDSTAGSPEASASNAQRIYCPMGWERLLPGDYYACRARYHLQRKHPRQAIDTLKDAAYWANKDAQHALGLAYVNGDVAGTPANRPLGVAWLALAAERKDPDYVRDYQAVVLRSNKDDILQASKMYVTLKETYGDGVAGPRATRRFVHEVKFLDDAAASGGLGYISGMTPYPQSASSLSLKLHRQAEEDFEGLQGTVSVGMLERVAAPSPALLDKYQDKSSGK